MADASTKKIRFYDLSELEIYNITEQGDSLSIDFTGQSVDTLIADFKKSDNLATLEYYVGFDLVKVYAKYVVYVSAKETANVLISVDNTVVDESTESGYKEVRKNVQTVVIRKKTTDERLTALENEVGV